MTGEQAPQSELTELPDENTAAWAYAAATGSRQERLAAYRQMPSVLGLVLRDKMPEEIAQPLRDELSEQAECQRRAEARLHGQRRNSL